MSTLNCSLDDLLHVHNKTPEGIIDWFEKVLSTKEGREYWLKMSLEHENNINKRKLHYVITGNKDVLKVWDDMEALFNKYVRVRR